jgi:NTE family protein
MLSNITVVLGGGGVWGVAWMTGLLRGLADAGLDLSTAGSFIGTSAGSVLSTQLCCGRPLEWLYERQVRPELQPRERAPDLRAEPSKASADDWGILGKLLQDPEIEPAERGRRLGAFAMNSSTIPFADRRRDIVERLGLPSETWPKKALRITAVDAESGELVAFDARSGVGLVDAVSASCAVPGVWPPTPIGGRFYIDGGAWRTAENAHLASGADKVIVISPLGGVMASDPLLSDLEALRASGSRVALVVADEDSLRTGIPNLLDPATRAPGAAAGRRQGADVSHIMSQLGD